MPSALGATPVAMPQTETYDALQKGVVDGLVSPIGSPQGLEVCRSDQVHDSRTLGSSYSIAFFVAMNKKKWDSLPKDVQETIQKVNKEWIGKTAETWNNMDKEALELALSKGNQIIKLSPEEDARWAKAVSPIFDEYVKTTKEKGLPGQEALDFCRTWLKEHP